MHFQIVMKEFNRPHLSVKLIALYPRFEFSKIKDIEQDLFPKVVSLVEEIKDKNLTITFDAEEVRKLDSYLLLKKTFEKQIVLRFQRYWCCCTSLLN